MTWQQVALVALNTAQVIALAALAVWERRTSRETRTTRQEVERINGELQAAVREAGSDARAAVHDTRR